MDRLGYLFYLVNPSKTMFEDVTQVPAYITEAIPFFISLLVIEQMIAWYKGIQNFKINDAITSAGQGILMEQSKIFCPAFSVFFYTWIYDKYRVMDLPRDSVWTWILAMIAIDFGFYWFHRACHEVNFLWAAHQAHHSSEYFNLTTALRQSVPQLYFHTIFYLPLALFLPPSFYLVHFEFNTLFQFWIHTELVDHLGFLGAVINTPSHHRVHHGRNRYCIDKNYASVFIVWDKMFGTFAAEGEKVVYGLTTPVQTFDPLTLQLGHYRDLMRRLAATKGIWNKVSVLVKGPGWDVGKPRLGHITDIPDINAQSDDILPFQPMQSFERQVYCAIHFFIVLFFHVQLSENVTRLTQLLILVVFAFVFLSLTSFGALMEGKKFAEQVELIRCLFFLFLDRTLILNAMTLTRMTIRLVFFASLLLWTARLLTRISFLQKISKGISSASRKT